MSEIDRHLSLCDPLLERDIGATGWRRAVRGVARIIRDAQELSPWEIAESLAQVFVDARLGPDRFGSRAAAAIARALPDSSDRDSLFRAVCVIAAANRVLTSVRLRVPHKVSRRNSMALGLWSALSFQRPLAEQRLEDVRAATMHRARVVGLELGRRSWTRCPVPGGDSHDLQNEALRWNAALDQDEIKVLRWALADGSALLGQPYSEVGHDGTLALAWGLDLGLLLARFPTSAHHRLAARDVPSQREADLDGLLTAIGEDRRRLAAPFEGNPIIQACPSVFPLLAALTRARKGQPGAALERSLEDWCGRALIESAIFVRSQRNSEGS